MRTTEILIFIFIVGTLFFNWPLLQIAGKQAILYLFIFWLIFIAIVAVAIAGKTKE